MLKVFIIYASKDEELFDDFEGRLEKMLDKKKLYESIKISSMKDFPPGKPSLKSNKKALKDNEVFLALHSRSFEESDEINDFEIASLRDEPSKEIIPIRFKETEKSYGGDYFLKTLQFFIPKRTQIKIYGDIKKITTLEDINSQRNMFVEELVDLLVTYKNKQSLGDTKAGFQYLQNFKSIDDFEKDIHDRRPIRICRVDDIVSNALLLMQLSPSVRHLVVVDSSDNLVGIISKRDVYRANFRHHFRVEGNLSQLDEFIKKEKVSSLMTNKGKLIAFPLSESPKILDVLNHFAPEQRRPIGVVIVTRKRDSFTKGDYDLISYIDVLKNFKNYACYEKLKNKKASYENLGTKPPIFSVNLNYTLSQAEAARQAQNVRGIPVVNDKKEFVGLITDNDFSLHAAPENFSKPVEKFMQRKDNVPVLNRNQTFEQLVELFVENREYTTLPLLTPDNKIERVIGYTDLLRKMKENW